MTGMNRLVSIIIPCYNQGHFLGEAIESVLRQTYRHFEVIVVDDGSTDDTAEVAARYRQVRCIRQENEGVSAARNTGLGESRGRYVVFLDADDRLLPNALELGVDCLRACPDCAFVFGQRRYIETDGSPLPTSEQPCVDTEHYVALLRWCFMSVGAEIFRRSVLESVGGFNVALPASEDYELYLRIARTHPIRCHSNVVVECRKHGQNVSRDYGLMLSSGISVVRSQRPYVAGDKMRESAYEAGLQRLRRHYGEQLVVKVQQCLLRKHWREAFVGLQVLARCYLKGFVKALCPGGYLAAVKALERAQNTARHLRRRALGQSTGSITVCPDPLELPDSRAHGVVTLSWTAERAETVEVHVDAPDGPLLSRAGPSGSQETGAWVRDGMAFYLQDVSGGLPLALANTLAVIHAKAIVVPDTDDLRPRHARASTDQ